MKLKYDFEIVELGDEYVAVPVGPKSKDYQGIIKLNETGSTIFRMLMNDMSENEIVSALEKEYDTAREQLTIYVHEIVTSLDEKGMFV